MPHSKLQVPCHRQPWLQRGMGPDTRQVRRIWNILLHLETIASRGDDFRGICNFNVQSHLQNSRCEDGLPDQLTLAGSIAAAWGV